MTVTLTVAVTVTVTVTVTMKVINLYSLASIVIEIIEQVSLHFK